ncbi:hypothetical protein [Tenacibaculum sp. IB213877]|uniref:hypothetical protein n=1 Tax=Tenacibaculum sp. IB213877 TaxID=3097351 RepID=UPI002A59DFE0|nr:hypothetical protein [Tenacibaculum sp. IB213877]MDY0780965.1 hypothetical protein [Tenacibaculum sp. IB213877]
MRTYLIGYDLNKSGQDYSTLIEKIKEIGNWWHCLDSTFIIKTNNSSSQVRDYLLNFIDQNDKLLVVRLYGEGAWTGFDTNCSKWLKENLSLD